MPQIMAWEHEVEHKACEQLFDNLSIQKAYGYLLYKVIHIYCTTSN